jgi:hypothetical protein
MGMRSDSSILFSLQVNLVVHLELVYETGTMLLPIELVVILIEKAIYNAIPRLFFSTNSFAPGNYFARVGDLKII